MSNNKKKNKTKKGGKKRRRRGTKKCIHIERVFEIMVIVTVQSVFRLKMYQNKVFFI